MAGEPGAERRGLVRIVLAELIDQGAGGYLTGPASVVDGQPYIIERAAPIRDLPGWLAAMLSRYTERLQRPVAGVHPD